MLTRLRLKDFKSFADQEVALGPTTLLVGANGSGKSNFLDAIRFLQGLALGFTPFEALSGSTEGGRKIWDGIRGGMTEVVRAGEEGFFEIESRWQRGGGQVEHAVSYGSDGTSNGHVFHISDASGPAFRDSLRATTLLDLQPHVMREHALRPIEKLGSTGENLSAVVWHMSQDSERKQDLIAWLTELCSPTIVDIDFVMTDLVNEVMLVLVEEDGTRVSARTLSDGTLRFLGTLVALLTTKDGDLLLIEELETGLHPGRVHLIVELIEAVTRKRGAQVIATTHSPYALLALSPAALRDAIIFGRHPDHVGTIMRRLGDLPHFDEVRARTGIDEMFETRWLERSL